MVIMTAKLSKRKRIAIVLLLVLAVIVACVCIGRASNGETETPPQTGEETQMAAIKTNEDRVAFLKSFGWEISTEPVQTQQVRVPTDPSEVFLRYNELQKSQGYDLMALAGKTLGRYVYEVLNYPDANGGGTYYATLLVYDNAVVGGDVCSSAKGGVMQGLKMPEASKP